MRTIPVTPAYPEQTQRVELDGVAYQMRIYWTQFDEQIKEAIGTTDDGKWYMDLSSDDITLNGIALVGGANLLEPYAYNQLGGLIVVDSELKYANPTYDGLGDRFQLIYVTRAEYEEFLANDTL